ncbi:helix-turn-helix domain-containing protein [Pseudomonas sp.]|uniref:helix-turn-helix domain-containing protein n=1 Tax=Pseudomonas sp. TaxID=306 RepID=UPI0034E0D3CA
MALAEAGVIDSDCLPAELQGVAAALPTVAAPVAASNLAEQLGGDEVRHLYATLRQHQWNITAAASSFGISRSTLYRKMKRYGIVQPNEVF